jgi:hypothetical protein
LRRRLRSTGSSRCGASRTPSLFASRTFRASSCWAGACAPSAWTRCTGCRWSTKSFTRSRSQTCVSRANRSVRGGTCARDTLAARVSASAALCAGSPLPLVYARSSRQPSRARPLPTGVDRRKFASTIIDTGTTFLYLPPDAYKPLQTYFTTSCSWGLCATRKHKTRFNDEYCYSLTEIELGQFAPLSLYFDGSEAALELTSLEYTYEIKVKGVTQAVGRTLRCLAVFDNKHNGVVLGAAVLRNREVILDRARRRVGFVRADCARATPAGSILANNTFLSDQCGRPGRRRRLGEGNETETVGSAAPGALTFRLADRSDIAMDGDR